jgi:23S rRNA (guanosine2251-2'-O)-methyltransferase
VDAIEAALERLEPVRVLLVGRSASDRIESLAQRARAAGATIWRGGPGDLRRMSPPAALEQAIALLGAEPQATLEELLGRGGAVWLLHGAAYPSNVGFSVRTAEVSGASGVVVDGDFSHDARSRVRHVSMGADRLLPVLYAGSEHVVTRAKQLGFHIVALEDGGSLSPWEVELTGSVLLIVGNERRGIDRSLLSHCDAVVGIPMLGFVPSYNVQAALSMLAAERLRQLARGPQPSNH